MARQRRASSRATMPVVPEPKKGSRTVPGIVLPPQAQVGCQPFVMRSALTDLLLVPRVRPIVARSLLRIPPPFRSFSLALNAAYSGESSIICSLGAPHRGPALRRHTEALAGLLGLGGKGGGRR